MTAPVRTRLLALAFALACSTAAVAQDAPGVAGRISLTQGQVTLSGALPEAVSASVNWPVTAGMVLTTAPGARTEFQVGSTSVRLDGDSALEVTALDDETIHLQLFYGSAYVRVRSREVAAGFELATPTARVRLDEPGRLRVDAERAAATTVLNVFEGTGVLDAPGSSFTVRAGRRAQLSGEDVRTSLATRDGFDDWSAQRDAREDRAATAYVPPEMTGYADLNDYGTWQDSTDYGPLWMPRSVPAGWVPYRDGNWTWLDPWGWTWIDNSPWGYAPFHYGRWVQVRGRWCWAPGRHSGRPAWAPALVGWVGGVNWVVNFRNRDRRPAQGWYPLGPRDRFVPSYRARERHLHDLNAGVPGGGRDGRGGHGWTDGRNGNDGRSEADGRGARDGGDRHDGRGGPDKRAERGAQNGPREGDLGRRDFRPPGLTVVPQARFAHHGIVRVADAEKATPEAILHNAQPAPPPRPAGQTWRRGHLDGTPATARPWRRDGGSGSASTATVGTAAAPRPGSVAGPATAQRGGAITGSAPVPGVAAATGGAPSGTTGLSPQQPGRGAAPRAISPAQPGALRGRPDRSAGEAVRDRDSAAPGLASRGRPVTGDATADRDAPPARGWSRRQDRNITEPARPNEPASANRSPLETAGSPGRAMMPAGGGFVVPAPGAFPNPSGRTETSAAHGEAAPSTDPRRRVERGGWRGAEAREARAEAAASAAARAEAIRAQAAAEAGRAQAAEAARAQASAVEASRAQAAEAARAQASAVEASRAEARRAEASRAEAARFEAARAQAAAAAAARASERAVERSMHAPPPPPAPAAAPRPMPAAAPPAPVAPPAAPMAAPPRAVMPPAAANRAPAAQAPRGDSPRHERGQRRGEER